MTDQWALHCNDRSMPSQLSNDNRHSINELDNLSLIGQQWAMIGDVGGQ